MSTTTVPLDQHPTAADRETTLQLINRCIPVYAAGMHKASDEVLGHEAERLESEYSSPVVRSMRQIVDLERTDRAAKRAAERAVTL